MMSSAGARFGSLCRQLPMTASVRVPQSTSSKSCVSRTSPSAPDEDRTAPDGCLPLVAGEATGGQNVLGQFGGAAGDYAQRIAGLVL